MKIRFGRGLPAAATLALAILAGTVLAVPVPETTTEILKDRKGFVPYRNYEPLPGKVVGVLVSDVAPVMSQDGRSGPPDAMAFSRNLGSYRWMYTPADANPLITGLRVQVGEKGDQVKVYPALNMASPTTVKMWRIDAPYALVEVEVNDGLGAPADEGFVATNMKRLDGTRDYPLELPKVVAELRKKFAEHKKASQAALEGALGEAQKKWLKDRKPTGPRQTEELVYFTWLADKELLRVHFRARLSDGAYTEVPGGANTDPPFALPPRPGGPQLGAFPPPPPRPQLIRTGTTFGIEYGAAYEVNKKGEVERVLILPPEGFGNDLPPPPVGFPGRLPPRPIDP